MSSHDLEIVQRPLYSYAEADYLAGVSRGTARRWLTGYAYMGSEGPHVVQPPITSRRDAQGAASFLDLVEIIAIGRMRQTGLSLPRIRIVVHNCQEVLGVPRPLTRLRFKTDGRDIFVDCGPVLLEVGKRKGQQAWTEVLEPFLRDLDYAHDVARRWWPLGHDGGVLVDPDYGFGLPTVAGSGVRTEIILEQFRAGEPVAEIATDFNLSPQQVEQAVRFESLRAA
ncbi:MAG TPA: DUF433 domain-containing protein [Chloroflexota bacterium]|nr:DUF433 domain-containing protein [Chloroflexota bacterium]